MELNRVCLLALGGASLLAFLLASPRVQAQAPQGHVTAPATYTLPQYQLRDLGPCDPVSRYYSSLPTPAIASRADGLALAWDLNDYSLDNFQAYVWRPGYGLTNVTEAAPNHTGVVSGVNAAGQVAGELLGPRGSTLGYNPVDGFLWTPGAAGRSGTLQDLGTLGYGSYSVATALNNDGQVVGSSLDPQANSHAFLWTPGGTDGVPANPQMKDLSLLSPSFTSAVGINDAGEVVGGGGLLYADGQAVSLPPLDPIYSYSEPAAPLGINARGQVFGQGYFDLEPTGFLWTPNTPNGTVGQIIPIGRPPDDGGLVAVALNNAGQIAGSGTLQTYPYYSNHGFLWTPNAAFTDGHLQDVGALAVTVNGANDGSANGYRSSYTSQCTALNDAGDAVGFATARPPTPIPNFLQYYHGFVFTQGFMYDLNSLLTTRMPGLTVITATGISADGSIAALAADADGRFHAVLLTPWRPLTRTSSPRIEVLNPQRITQYSPEFTLYVTGNDFAPGSRIAWNGAFLPTVAYSNKLLSALVPAVNLAVSGPAAITVVNPEGTHAPTAFFQVYTGPEPVPSCVSLSPSTIYAGGGDQPIVFNGSGFFADERVEWGNDTFPLSHISADHTQATVVLPASVLAYPSQNDFLLSNPPYAEGQYSPIFSVLPYAPEVTSIAPRQLTAGAVGFLTITGKHFYQNGRKSPGFRGYWGSHGDG